MKIFQLFRGFYIFFFFGFIIFVLIADQTFVSFSGCQCVFFPEDFNDDELQSCFDLSKLLLQVNNQIKIKSNIKHQRHCNIILNLRGWFIVCLDSLFESALMLTAFFNIPTKRTMLKIWKKTNWTRRLSQMSHFYSSRKRNNRRWRSFHKVLQFFIYSISQSNYFKFESISHFL